MSRVTTPPSAQPVNQPSPMTAKVPHERIAMRAYEKWVQRGRPQGTALQDWVEAEAELMKELGRTGSTTTTGKTHR
jgi:Protein of unknown function (DUF2934)